MSIRSIDYQKNELLKKIETSDTISQFMEKCNSNFSTIIEYSGGSVGEKGDKGEQGVPAKPKVPIHVWVKGEEYSSETEITDIDNDTPQFIITLTTDGEEELTKNEYQEGHLIMLENGHVYILNTVNYTLEPNFIIAIQSFDPEEELKGLHAYVHFAYSDYPDGINNGIDDFITAEELNELKDLIKSPDLSESEYDELYKLINHEYKYIGINSNNTEKIDKNSVTSKYYNWFRFRNNDYNIFLSNQTSTIFIDYNGYYLQDDISNNEISTCVYLYDNANIIKNFNIEISDLYSSAFDIKDIDNGKKITLDTQKLNDLKIKVSNYILPITVTYGDFETKLYWTLNFITKIDNVKLSIDKRIINISNLDKLTLNVGYYINNELIEAYDEEEGYYIIVTNNIGTLNEMNAISKDDGEYNVDGFYYNTYVDNWNNITFNYNYGSCYVVLVDKYNKIIDYDYIATVNTTIGTKVSDSDSDVYYWTVDNEFLTDANGDYIRATAKDGVVYDIQQKGTDAYAYWYRDGERTDYIAEPKIDTIEVDGIKYWTINGIETNTIAEPKIGTIEENGIKYWTFNGEKLKHDNKKVIAEPTIGTIEENGIKYWTINGTNTGIQAEGRDGTSWSIGTVDDGDSDDIKYWFKNGENTGVIAEPTIGTIEENGIKYWTINGEELKHNNKRVIAEPKIGTHTKTEGGIQYWTINGEKTNIQAEGTSWSIGTVDDIKYWFKNGENTGVIAEPKIGTHTKTEGGIQYWTINGEKTNIQAEGTNGEDAEYIYLETSTSNITLPSNLFGTGVHSGYDGVITFNLALYRNGTVIESTNYGTIEIFIDDIKIYTTSKVDNISIKLSELSDIRNTITNNSKITCKVSYNRKGYEKTIYITLIETPYKFELNRNTIKRSEKLTFYLKYCIGGIWHIDKSIWQWEEIGPENNKKAYINNNLYVYFTEELNVNESTITKEQKFSFVSDYIENDFEVNGKYILKSIDNIFLESEKDKKNKTKYIIICIQHGGNNLYSEAILIEDNSFTTENNKITINGDNISLKNNNNNIALLTSSDSPQSIESITFNDMYTQIDMNGITIMSNDNYVHFNVSKSGIIMKYGDYGIEINKNGVNISPIAYTLSLNGDYDGTSDPSITLIYNGKTYNDGDTLLSDFIINNYNNISFEPNCKQGMYYPDIVIDNEKKTIDVKKYEAGNVYNINFENVYCDEDAIKNNICTINLSINNKIIVINKRNPNHNHQITILDKYINDILCNKSTVNSITDINGEEYQNYRYNFEIDNNKNIKLNIIFKNQILDIYTLVVRVDDGNDEILKKGNIKINNQTLYNGDKIKIFRTTGGITFDLEEQDNYDVSYTIDSENNINLLYEKQNKYIFKILNSNNQNTKITQLTINGETYTNDQELMLGNSKLVSLNNSIDSYNNKPEITDNYSTSFHHNNENIVVGYISSTIEYELIIKPIDILKDFNEFIFKANLKNYYDDSNKKYVQLYDEYDEESFKRYFGDTFSVIDNCEFNSLTNYTDNLIKYHNNKQLHLIYKYKTNDFDWNKTFEIKNENETIGTIVIYKYDKDSDIDYIYQVSLKIGDVTLELKANPVANYNENILSKQLRIIKTDEFYTTTSEDVIIIVSMDINGYITSIGISDFIFKGTEYTGNTVVQI